MNEVHAIFFLSLIKLTVHFTFMKFLWSILRLCHYKNWKKCMSWILIPCPFTGRKMFCAGPSFWVSPKIWLHLVPLQKLLCWHKNQFYWMQIIFLSGTKCLWLPQYVNRFLVWHKKFGPAQNILGPVKGQGISFFVKK